MNKIIDVENLIKIYKMGYFPMAENAESEEIFFYQPKKRFIIPINSFHIPKKLFIEFKKDKYEFFINKNFSEVIKRCSTTKRKNNGTWINKIIIDTYIELYEKDYAISIECYHDKKLVGGLYGLYIGACFFGESMFSEISNTSKLSLLYLISILKEHNFNLLDSQFHNQHLLQFGAYEISSKSYLQILNYNINKKCLFPKKFNFEKSYSILQSFNHKS